MPGATRAAGSLQFHAMYLKQVIIDGFKSFADKTVIDLTAGITCIVGPNGCGKSNIVDAIRWVLGEQSAKALRGGKMQDVIFQGTEGRKPLQFCSVSLLFSDCEAQLGTHFNEVEITRKVSRDGGGEYFINGKASRLKDIQGLFMDTGVGRVSYSFMVQGQIDQILSSNPGERRSIFEEAAGITKYKSQRREALNKLALVEQNLARATDRMEEIGRQIGSLRRQASKALRYKRLSHRLRHLDLAVNARAFAELNAKLAGDDAIIGEISARILSLGQKLSAADAELSQMRSERAEEMTQLESARQAAAETRSQKEQAERNSEFAGVRKRDLGERAAQINRELESLRGQLSALEGRASGDAEVKQMQLALVSDSDEAFKRHNDEMSAIEQKLREAENALSQARQDALVAEGAITKLRVKCTSLELDLKSYQVRHAALSDSIYQIKEEKLSFEGRIEQTRAALEGARERLENADADAAGAQARADELKAQYRAQQEEIQQMDRRLASKSAKLSLLNEFQARMEGFSDGVKAILKGSLSDLAGPDSARVVSQCAEVSDQWAPAFETLLGAAIDAVELSDESKLPQIAGRLREGGFGKACFQTRASSVDEFDRELPAGIIRAADALKCSDESAAPAVMNLVRGCYFCDDIFAFAEFAKSEPDFRFFAAADKNLNMLDARGLLYAAGSQSRDTESGFILRNSEIRRLNAEIEADNAALTELNERAMQIQSELSSAEAEIESRKNAAAEIRREMASMNAQIGAAESALAEKNADLERKNSAIAEMENSRFEAQDRLDSAQRELAEAEKSAADSRGATGGLEAEISRLRQERDAKSQAMSEARIDLAQKKSRLENLERGLGEIRRQQESARAEIERRAGELESIAAQTESLDRQTAEETERAKSLAESLEAQTAQIEQKRAEISRREERISEFESSIAGDREALMRANSEKNDCDVRAAKLRSRLEYISERISADYELDIAGIDWKSELWKADEEFEVKVKLDGLEEGEEPDIKPRRERGEPTEEDFAAMDKADMSEIEEQVRGLREKIGSMGAVNLVAIEEYSELKERYDFLKAQTDDLWTSKNALVADIDEINETSQQMFAQTFEQIRKNFAFTFEKVFGGGAADLKLVESEDVLDSGIEIVARPPGTMLKSLSLLSGGQRTMTAVALLFAIYMVKPSPFCVLDELDAPLDDANIGRYTDLLKEFTRYSQFLVISHNKRTVSAAKTIYGVTMQERGVTRLISMRFNDENSAENAGGIGGAQSQTLDLAR